MKRLVVLSFAAALASVSGCSSDCNDTCSSAGATRCSGTQVQTCTADAKGCLSLSPAAACGAGQFCTAATNACAPCVDTCSVAGVAQCSGSQIQGCAADANGCLSLTTPAACPANQSCIAGECGTCVRTVTASAAAAANVQAFGTRTVGEIVTFTVPPGTGGFSIVSQAVNAQTTDIRFLSGGQVFAIPNSVVPEIVLDPSGATFYDDTVNPPADLSTALAVYNANSPATGAFTVPNTTTGLNAFASGVPAGNWRFKVSDFAQECVELGPASCTGGSTTSTYDITVITHPAIGTTGTLDVGIYLVTNSFTAATAAADPGMQRMVATLGTIYGRAGLTSRVTFYDVPASAKTKFATGVSADRTGPCEELDQMFTLSLPGKNELNLFFVDDILQQANSTSNTSIVGIDGTIPGPASFGGTVHSGAVVNASDVGIGTCGSAIDVIRCGSDRVAYIAAHEGGHFMGLYHTTESVGGFFDPVADTGQCLCTACAPAAARARCFQNNPAQAPTQVFGPSCNTATCKGAEYLMFWVIDSVASVGNITTEQARIMRANPLVQ